MTSTSPRSARFDLLAEGCIPVLTGREDPGMEWLPLPEVFERAEHLTAVTWPTPGGVIAVYELLLALCYAAGISPPTAASWRRMVNDRTSLVPGARWLRDPANAGLFGLGDPVRPFGQNILLAPYLNEYGLRSPLLVMERAGHYNQFADHVHLYDDEPLPAREAFIALLVQHAYAVGRTCNVKEEWLGRSLRYAARGRLARRVRVIALGDTVGDTLRLNLGPAWPTGVLNTTWEQDGCPRRKFTGRDATWTRQLPCGNLRCEWAAWRICVNVSRPGRGWPGLRW